MTTTASAAAQAYAAAARAVADAAKGTAAQAKTPGDGEADFGAALQQAVASVSGSIDKADATTMAQVAGKADVVDVVTAVAETEVALRTLVSVRDRVIATYQEIMRMPI